MMLTAIKEKPLGDSMDPSFSIALGNGMYMDSEGNITSTPVPNKPLYKPKSGLPVCTVLGTAVAAGDPSHREILHVALRGRQYSGLKGEIQWHSMSCSGEQPQKDGEACPVFSQSPGLG